VLPVPASHQTPSHQTGVLPPARPEPTPGFAPPSPRQPEVTRTPEPYRAEPYRSEPVSSEATPERSTALYTPPTLSSPTRATPVDDLDDDVDVPPFMKR
jgi:cell division protein FtsZ